MRADEIDDFLAQVEYVQQEVNGLVTGKTDVSASIERERQKKAIEEIRKREAAQKLQEEEERIARGVSGKGEKFDRYQSYCPYCQLEYRDPRDLCVACQRPTQTSAERKEYLMGKVEELKRERSSRAEKKLKWENWKKTQAMLYKKTSTVYRKWDFFVDEDSDEEKPEFVPPENDPNFKALEDDIKERAQKRRQDLKESMALKDQGNAFFKQGKYRNALGKYEEAQDKKKDYMILYTNSAIARIKLEDYEGAIKDCSRVLEYCEIFEDGYEKSRDTCFKALIRRGDAYRHTGRATEAVNDFTQALDLKHDPEIETLVDRTAQEGREVAEPAELEVTDAEEIMKQLNEKERILGFIHSAGCVTLFKRVVESKDEGALRVLEFLFEDESNYSYLRPLLSSVYDKRRIGAVVLLDSIERNLGDPVWGSRIIRLVGGCIENIHIREELVKHSACTKGKKICIAVFNLFTTADDEELLKDTAGCMANLCLSKFKSSFERRPNPGNIKAVVRHRWEEFVPQFIRFLQSSLTEALGLLCNLATEPKLKLQFLELPEVMEAALSAVTEGVQSLPVERGLGYLINSCTNPTSIRSLEGFLDRIYRGCSRILSLSQPTAEIAYRGYLLMFRLLMAKPELAEALAEDEVAFAAVTRGLETHPDVAAKIVTAGSSSPVFCGKLPTAILLKLSQEAAHSYFETENLHERLGNLGLALGRIAQNAPDRAPAFKPLIEPFVRIIKDSLGPVRKNLAVSLGKLAENEENREELRRCHGIEVLQSVMRHLGK